jgi:hypothetical protein
VAAFRGHLDISSIELNVWRERLRTQLFSGVSVRAISFPLGTDTGWMKEL